MPSLRWLRPWKGDTLEPPPFFNEKARRAAPSRAVTDHTQPLKPLEVNGRNDNIILINNDFRSVIPLIAFRTQAFMAL
jgi:hypothetical protein